MIRAMQLILMLAISLTFTVAAYAHTVITRVSDKQNVTLTELTSAAERSDLIFVGEAHDSKEHHEMQLTLIRSLWAKKLPIAIGLEMFQADSQDVLDSWTAGKLSEQSFKLVYAKNWSLDWALYRDIFLFARDNHIPMVGLNVSKALVTKVSRKGFASLTPEERKDLPQGTTCDLNNPHTAFLEASFKEVFKHVANGRVFTYFCEAQTLRNSGMAVNVSHYLKKNPGKKIVGLMGIWHAAKNAIPEQLERRGSKLTSTIVMPEIPELKAGNITSDVADYLISE